MNSIPNIKYFILLKKKNISFQAFDKMDKVILKKEIFINNYSINNVFSLIKDFLEKNIFDIERSLNDFVKKIYIIFESDLLFEARTSIKYSFQKTNFEHDNIKDLLLEIKDQFKKFSPEDHIIHMVIENYILEGQNYETLPKDIHSKNLVIEVNFVCLNNKIVKDFEKIFSKYQISVKKILSYNYLKKDDGKEGNNIFKLADHSINGLFKNEVFITNKAPQNPGFFEKFFNFFN